MLKYLSISSLMLGILLILPSIVNGQVAAEPGELENFADQVGNTIFGKNSERFATTVVVLIGLAVLSLAPALIMMMTSFIRIIIVLSFARTALATQQMPPNQVLVGLALFLTLFIMYPTFSQIWEGSISPYLSGEETSMEETMDRAVQPLRRFMLNQMDTEGARETLFKFISMTNIAIEKEIESYEDIPTYVIIPAYMLSELKRAFQIGVLIFIPFIIIDIVISSILLSMGLIFLPPVLVSLPFKILLFVLVDGWQLLIQTLILGFKI